jgi:hypothetical protein
VKTLKKIAGFFKWLDEEDAPSEPRYDPVHLGAVLVVTMTVIGMLYWLLWTLLVYEGRIGNISALIIAIALLAALHRAYHKAGKKRS